MFDLKNLSKNNFRIVNLTVYIVYFLLILVVPLIVIGVHYELFSETTEEDLGMHLSGWGLVFIGVVGAIGLVTLRKVIDKIPEAGIGSARLKYSLNFLTELIGPAIVIAILFFMKDNFDRAYGCAKDIVVVYIAAAAYKWLLLSSVQRESRLRDKAREVNEVDARRGVV